MSKENQTKYSKPPVVTRTEWGCPDEQTTTHGSLGHTTVTHLIVHHTAMGVEAPDSDWPALVRSIWNFHVFEREWADIGAHFSGVNAGTMAVALLGDFTNAAPANDAVSSLKEILAWKCDQRGLDPEGRSLHEASQLILNTISGHRDGPKATECPGEAIYLLLPAIRTEVKNLIGL